MNRDPKKKSIEYLANPNGLNSIKITTTTTITLYCCNILHSLNNRLIETKKNMCRQVKKTENSPISSPFNWFAHFFRCLNLFLETHSLTLFMCQIKMKKKEKKSEKKIFGLIELSVHNYEREQLRGNESFFIYILNDDL